MPNIFEKAFPLTRFVVKRDPDALPDIIDPVYALRKFPIAPELLEGSTMEKASGWTSAVDPLDTTFESTHPVLADGVLHFAFRLDKKSVSARLVDYTVREKLKAERQDAEERGEDARRSTIEKGLQPWDPDHEEGYKPPSRKRLRELKAATKANLMASATPVPNSWDVIWHPSGEVWMLCATESIIGAFRELFERTFEGYSLYQIDPLLLSGNASASGVRYLTDYLWARQHDPNAHPDGFDWHFGGALSVSGHEATDKRQVTIKSADTDSVAELTKEISQGLDITRAELVISTPYMDREKDEEGEVEDEATDHFTVAVQAVDLSCKSIRPPSLFLLDKKAAFDEASFFERLGLLRRLFQAMDRLYMASLTIDEEAPGYSPEIEDMAVRLREADPEQYAAILAEWAAANADLSKGDDGEAAEPTPAEEEPTPDLDDEPAWIPKSMTRDIRPEYPDRGDEITLEIPEWLAEDNDLEYT